MSKLLIHGGRVVAPALGVDAVVDVPLGEGRGSAGGPADAVSAGGRVGHPKVGEGIVVSSEPSGTDYQVVIAFQGEAGIKKLLLSFAPLEKIEA